MKTFFLLILFLFATVASGANVADILILDSPKSFTLYNQFAQPISESEKSGILPGSPLQIIKPDATLGDQITRVMECVYRHQTLFILKQEKGDIIGDKTQFRLLKSCTLLGDTVEITKERAVAFSDKEIPIRSSGNTLQKGDILVLLFRYKNSMYALQTSPAQRFGWVPAASRESWKRVKKTFSVDTSMSANIREQLTSKIESANALYKTFFEQFNLSTGGQKSIPQWTKSISGSDVAWALSPPYDQTGELDESAKLLVENLRDIMFNKPFSVQLEKGRITVSRKATVGP